MGTLRFADLQTRPTEVLDLTSLTLDEFRQLVPPFETAFQSICRPGGSMDTHATVRHASAADTARLWPEA